MTYDQWKTTNPDDQWLGPDPEEMAMYDKQTALALSRAHQAYDDGEMTLGDLGEVYLDCGYHPYHVRKILSHHTKYPIPANYFGKEE